MSVRNNASNHNLQFFPSTNGTAWGNASVTLTTGGTMCLGSTGFVSGDTFLRFAGDRPWEFCQDGSDAAANLVLRADTDQKNIIGVG